ncbi:MAG: lipo-like protein [bacterium]|nr:lipo-like protein [bacterium]MCP5071107.1 lipo-like protein [bacterium]
MGLRRWITNRIVEFLTEPLARYERRGWNDPQALRRHLRKGDVVLVEGDNRVSAIIKYLTQSSWSHATLFVGDELVRQGGPAAERVKEQFGDDAEWLIVEALPHGVVASPVTKYIDYNIRVARPHRIQPEDLKLVLDDQIDAIGWRYDLRNVLDLGRYLFPVRIIPDRFRRTALHFGSSMPTEVICSSLLGRTFHKVRFPILPHVEFPDGFDSEVEPSPGVRGRFLRRIFGYESGGYTGLFKMRHPTLLTPRDFDLSPYFEIVKFNVIADGRFDYQRIHWASLDDDVESQEPHPRPYGAEPPLPPIDE